MNTINKFWVKFFPRSKQSWKTNSYFGIGRDESLRGHMVLSGAKIVNNKIIDGDIYYLRDVCGNVWIDRAESGERLR